MRPPSLLSVYSDVDSLASDHTVRAVCAADIGTSSPPRPFTAVSEYSLDFSASGDSSRPATDNQGFTITVESASTCVGSSNHPLTPASSRSPSQLSAFLTDDLSKFADLFYKPTDDSELPIVRPPPARLARQVSFSVCLAVLVLCCFSFPLASRPPLGPFLRFLASPCSKCSAFPCSHFRRKSLFVRFIILLTPSVSMYVPHAPTMTSVFDVEEVTDFEVTSCLQGLCFLSGSS